MASRTSIPNGAEGYLWTDARVIWNNGACLNVQNTLSYPEDGPGTQHAAHFDVLLIRRQRRDDPPLRSIPRYRILLRRRSQTLRELPPTTEPSADYFQFVDLG